MSFSGVATIVGLAVNGLGLFFVALQVRLAAKQLHHVEAQAESESRRLRRQATIDFYMLSVGQVSEWRSRLPPDWEAEGVTHFVEEAIASDEVEALNDLASYLGFFEALAVGVISEVYDLDTLHKISSSRIRNIVANYQQFFLHRRTEANAPRAYVNLETLAQLLAACD